jgi:hypothetical protein
MNKRRLLFAACYTTISLCLFSCTAETYLINAPNPSFLEKKGEKKVQAQAGHQGIQPQWAMALTNHVGYQVNSFVGLMGQTYVEGLGGIYAHSKRFYMESYVGAGWGYSDNSIIYTPLLGHNFDKHVLSNYVKLPVQLNLAVQVKNVKVFMVNRISCVHVTDYNSFSSEERDLRGTNGYNVTTKSAVAKNLEGFIWDAGLGVKYDNFIFQGGISYNWFAIPQYVETRNSKSSSVVLQSEYFTRPMEYIPVYITIGYTFKFKSRKDKVELK